eukprot:TRINITY_DN3900_c3_g1_i1.p1 TRINITY_DN3900_c3_g1~~TRINITY_DN3900_c3_g1_i1.p1  ORF type:complete len:120 (-),score=9.10 TRINITY_DN3900_c3_g1_i1:1173-1532(-)
MPAYRRTQLHSHTWSAHTQTSQFQLKWVLDFKRNFFKGWWLIVSFFNLKIKKTWSLRLIGSARHQKREKEEGEGSPLPQLELLCFLLLSFLTISSRLGIEYPGKRRVTSLFHKKNNDRG